MRQKLLIGDKAPVFCARSTEGDFCLENTQGRWILASFCPQSFTPVATSELLAQYKMKSIFNELKCSYFLVTGSSLFSNLAWIMEISSIFGVQIDTPVLEDPTYAIFKEYGVFSSISETRAFFIIDPFNNIRWFSEYPQNVGQSLSEIIRILRALQHVDETRRLAPADWLPGDCTYHAAGLTRAEILKLGPTWFYRTEDEKVHKQSSQRGCKNLHNPRDKTIKQA